VCNSDKRKEQESFCLSSVKSSIVCLLIMKLHAQVMNRHFAVSLFFVLGMGLAHGFLQATITAPSGIAGRIDFNPALFGVQPSSAGLVGQVVDVTPFDGCMPLSNTSSGGISVAGKILLIYANGNCLLGNKALNAQLAGAIGVALYMCTPNAPGTNAGRSLILKVRE
jgi:hypothetical protein